jgi:hypothetical protein
MRSYATKLERVCEISLRFQPPNTITAHLHSFKTITRFPFYSPSFSQQPRLIILFFLKKLMGTNIFKIELKIMSEKRESFNDPSLPFKEKEKEGEGRSKAWWPMEGEGEGSLLGGKWKEKEKVFCLVANGRRRRRFFAWWQMEGEGEGFLLGGQWKEKEKVLCLVANGRRRRRFFAWWPMEAEGEGSLFGG